MDSVMAFERSMSMIAPIRTSTGTPGRHVMVLADPTSVTGKTNRARMLARRRTTLRTLTLLAVVSAAFALSVGEPFIWTFAASGSAWVGYAALLRRQHRRRTEARRKTRRLPAVQRTSAPNARPQARRRGA
ncbi:MAG: hypothetical protein ACRDU8_06800 [Egibacteraceae bacterium]